MCYFFLNNYVWAVVQSRMGFDVFVKPKLELLSLSIKLEELTKTHKATAAPEKDLHLLHYLRLCPWDDRHPTVKVKNIFPFMFPAQCPDYWWSDASTHQQLWHNDTNKKPLISCFLDALKPNQWQGWLVDLNAIRRPWLGTKKRDYS